MNEQNPAVAQQLAVPPAMLEAVEKDPRVLSGVARKMLLVQMDAIHRRLRDPNAPIGQRQAFADFLAKVGDAVPKASSQGAVAAGVSINVVFGDNAAAAAKTVEIVQEANELEDGEEEH